MIELLKELIPEFSHFEQSELRAANGLVGYQSVLILKTGFPFSGGTHYDLNLARQICAAEAIERAHVIIEREKASTENDPFGLLISPTSCGFAAGFKRESTAFRSVCEAVERWCWSKWIDANIAPASVQLRCASGLQSYFASAFEKVYAFESLVSISSPLPSFIPKDLKFAAVIGVKDGGIFPGSRVSTIDDDLLTHSLLESWRHLSIFRNELRDSTPTTIIDQRIKQFGRNGERELPIILKLKVGGFPSVNLRFVKEVVKGKPYFVWRSLADDFVPWHIGDEKRFVY